MVQMVRMVMISIRLKWSLRLVSRRTCLERTLPGMTGTAMDMWIRYSWSMQAIQKPREPVRIPSGRMSMT